MAVPPLALLGKTALVCGASQGIGLACAKELASLGARIFLLARNESDLKIALNELDNGRSEHAFFSCDLSESSRIDVLLTQIPAQIDILVCNSGGPAPGPLTDSRVVDLEKAFFQHVVANLRLVQHCLPHMKSKQFGRIINIISTSVKIPIPGLGVSNIVRGAMASAAKTLSLEVGSFGITVNNILPGFTKTQRLDQIIQNQAIKTGRDKESVALAMMQDVPAKRFGSAQEIAHVCAFLASDLASYVNGVSLPVDGGRTGSL